MPTRSACVIAGASPEQIAADPDIARRANRLGTLITGRLDGRVIDYAHAFDGPVYDVMWNADTGWFAVTIYRDDRVTRWHNRDNDAGYPVAVDVLGATTPRTILEVLDVPGEVIGYFEG